MSLSLSLSFSLPLSFSSPDEGISAGEWGKGKKERERECSFADFSPPFSSPFLSLSLSVVLFYSISVAVPFRLAGSSKGRRGVEERRKRKPQRNKRGPGQGEERERGKEEKLKERENGRDINNSQGKRRTATPSLQNTCWLSEDSFNTPSPLNTHCKKKKKETDLEARKEEELDWGFRNWHFFFTSSSSPC